MMANSDQPRFEEVAVSQRVPEAPLPNRVLNGSAILLPEDPESILPFPRPLPPTPTLSVASLHRTGAVLVFSDMAGNANNFPSLDGPMSNNRQGASPTSSHSGQANGNGMSNANYMAPLPVGHQQDLNYLYSQLQELGGILRSNRDRVQVITKGAEEIARRANGAAQFEGDAAKEVDSARVREIEHELAKANHIISLYKHEQTENTKLIANYEDEMGNATEQIRNYCSEMNGRFLAQRRYYNDLLQQEKDEHLQSRLERDEWHAKTMRVCEMIRTAYNLRCEESNEELVVVSDLQAQVRILRKCLGMEREKPEEESGWPYLKNAPLNIEGCDET